MPKLDIEIENLSPEVVLTLNKLVQSKLSFYTALCEKNYYLP
jgi:hypothetical protein